MKRMLTVLAVVVTAAAVQVVQAETLGLWTFDGHSDGELMTYDTALPAKVGNKGLSLKLVAMGPKVSVVPSGYPAKFSTSTLPKPSAIYSDMSQTELLCEATSAAFIDSAGVSGDWMKTGSGLKVEGFGKTLKEHDFTIEIVVKPGPRNSRKYDSWGHGNSGASLLAISSSADAAASPALWLNDHNKGSLCFRNKSSETVSSNTSFFDHYWFSDRENGSDSLWAHIAITYSHESGTVTVIHDYGRSSGIVTYDADKLPLDDESYLMFNGAVGTQNAVHPNTYYAAIRISDRVLSENEMMTLSYQSSLYQANPVVGWWRFEEGTPGATAGGETSLVLPNSISAYADGSNDFLVKDFVRSRLRNTGYSKHNAVTYNYAAASKRYAVTRSGDGREYFDNRVSLSSSQFVSTSTGGMKPYVSRMPALAAPGSITLECCYCRMLDTTPGPGTGGLAWHPVNLLGTSTMAINESADSYAGLQLTVKTVDRATGAMKSSYDASHIKQPTVGKWHHVAIVYDCPAEDQPKSVKYYIDRNLIYTANIPADETLAPCDGALHLPGSEVLSGHASFWGYIDEPRVTRKALEPSQFLRLTDCYGMVIVVE